MKSFNPLAILLNTALSTAITHPGLLHTEADIARIQSFISNKTSDSYSPQLTGWKKLSSNADSNYTPSAAETVCRGSSCADQNYPSLYRDMAAAYANAVYWRVIGSPEAEANADAAAGILDDWSGTMRVLEGSSDKYLASGLYGYQMANAAEVLRGYEGWDAGNGGLEGVVRLLSEVFLPMNVDFLENHNGAEIDHYWANVSPSLILVK